MAAKYLGSQFHAFLPKMAKMAKAAYPPAQKRPCARMHKTCEPSRAFGSSPQKFDNFFQVRHCLPALLRPLKILLAKVKELAKKAGRRLPGNKGLEDDRLRHRLGPPRPRLGWATPSSLPNKSAETNSTLRLGFTCSMAVMGSPAHLHRQGGSQVRHV